MENKQASEILQVATNKAIAETGGGHNQKGIEFQRVWAVYRMFTLVDSGAKDFLFLFEVIQDVAVLDSVESPTQICLYQVKKDDRKEWTWARLTNLPEPGKKRRVTKNKPAEINDSPIGKLYSSIVEFSNLKSSGAFVSNRGCDLKLTGGRNAATSVSSDLSQLEATYLAQLTTELKTLHGACTLPVDPSLIHIEKFDISTTTPIDHLIGVVAKFLNKRSPKHAGQAESLVNALLMKVAPLSAKTDACSTIEEICKERGYSYKEFVLALRDLESLPDVEVLLDGWLVELLNKGAITFMEKPAITVAAAKIARLKLLDHDDPLVDSLLLDVNNWLDRNELEYSLVDFFSKARKEIASAHPEIRFPEFAAHFLVRALEKCVDLS
ncbi:dsDNA nuclease domain-containing protein [Magnetofaba australis]|uniref:CD-NTase associated protein 4-like DNA endonuclease domain-containing protein n=1 Tax=Magnetofaba australis IT-1 TaxID=1434232 RepID=A0A1Y2K8E9_9PROT|nr:dsDNA nuclease domain-containing protein [Magnetofaba australis]OSM07030.1 hypothetical protein MAIT1_00060 [Magnetofaba australis IT-1]